MANGQAAIAGQLPTLLGGLYERVADTSQRRGVIGAMRVARWWVIACDRVDKAEAAIHLEASSLCAGTLANSILTSGLCGTSWPFTSGR